MKSCPQRHFRLSPGLTVSTLVLFPLLAGCHVHEPAECQRIPAVTTRFTANPLLAPFPRPVMLQPQQAPNVRVGLHMQSGPDTVHAQFASRLGTVLVRELQLSPGSFQVQPLAGLQLNAQAQAIESSTSSDIRSVAFQESQNTLPPQLPPSPLFLTPAPPLVDQILIVRVIEYRPYFPMLATLEIQVLDGGTEDTILTTTVSWSGEDYRLTACTPRKTWRQKLFCHEPCCDPAPGHNSPQALMHEIAKDISAWYTSSVNSPMPAAEQAMPNAEQAMPAVEQVMPNVEKAIPNVQTSQTEHG